MTLSISHYNKIQKMWGGCAKEIVGWEYVRASHFEKLINSFVNKKCYPGQGHIAKLTITRLAELEAVLDQCDDAWVEKHIEAYIDETIYLSITSFAKTSPIDKKDQKKWRAAFPEFAADAAVPHMANMQVFNVRKSEKVCLKTTIKKIEEYFVAKAAIFFGDKSVALRKERHSRMGEPLAHQGFILDTRTRYCMGLTELEGFRCVGPVDARLRSLWGGINAGEGRWIECHKQGCFENVIKKFKTNALTISMQVNEVCLDDLKEGELELLKKEIAAYAEVGTVLNARTAELENADSSWEEWPLRTIIDLYSTAARKRRDYIFAGRYTKLLSADECLNLKSALFFLESLRHVSADILPALLQECRFFYTQKI